MTPPDSPDPLYVIGHRNPDTDAICSAIGYAAFLRDSRGDHAVPARCGELSVRTAWVLNHAEVPVPRLLMDVRPTAASVCHRDVISARRSETFLSVYRKMMYCIKSNTIQSVKSLPCFWKINH